MTKLFFSALVKMPRVLLVSLMIFVMVVSQVVKSLPTFAAEKTFQTYSPIDTYTQANYSSQYDLDFLEVGLYDNNSNDLNVWLHYKAPIMRDMFTVNSDAWAAVLIWTTESRAMLGGNDQDFRISSNYSIQYPTNNSTITARAYVPDSSGAIKVDLSRCSPVTWTDVSAGVKWIGFKISRSCAGIPDKFWIAGYTSYASGKYDWAPEKAFYVDLTSKPVVTPSPSASATRVFSFEQEIDIDLPKKPRAGNTIDVTVFFPNNLPEMTVRTPKVCSQPSKYRDNTYSLRLLKAGICRFDLFDLGSEVYLPYADTWEFEVLAAVGVKPSPKPKKIISGSASTTKVPASTPSKKPSTSTKIGGTADTNKS